MVAIPVPTLLAPVVWTVGMHGLTDAVTHTKMIPAYALAIPSWPFTTSYFTVASIFHFSEDIGFRNSILLHTCIVLVASLSVPFAMTLVLTYMCVVHVPCHLHRVERKIGRITALKTTIIGFLFVAPTLPLSSIPDMLQRVACIHIGIHLARPLS